MATTPCGRLLRARNGYGLLWTATNHVPITPLYDEGLGAAAVAGGGVGGGAGLATHVNLNKRKLLFVPN